MDGARRCGRVIGGEARVGWRGTVIGSHECAALFAPVDSDRNYDGNCQGYSP